MYQYYVVEIIKTQAGDFDHNVLWLYDETDRQARLKGESKYHEIMSRAALSTHAEHSVILFSSRAEPILVGCYDHEVVPEVEE